MGRDPQEVSWQSLDVPSLFVRNVGMYPANRWQFPRFYGFLVFFEFSSSLFDQTEGLCSDLNRSANETVQDIQVTKPVQGRILKVRNNGK